MVAEVIEVGGDDDEFGAQPIGSSNDADNIRTLRIALIGRNEEDRGLQRQRMSFCSASRNNVSTLISSPPGVLLPSFD